MRENHGVLDCLVGVVVVVGVDDAATKAAAAVGVSVGVAAVV